MSLDKPKKNASFLIIGAGAWGLALANTLARINPTVFLWDGDSKLLDSLKKIENILFSAMILKFMKI